jgi:Arm DNA-binding domain
MLALELSQFSKGQQMPLSDTAIRQVKATDITQKLSDGGGLQLWIEPKGSKLWRLAYRYDGKQKKLAIGVYPVVTLAEARDRREQAKRLLASGVDPGQQKKLDRLEKANSEANTFALIAAELLAKKRREGKASATIGKREWLYAQAGEAFGKRAITEISTAEILAVLRKVEGKGLIDTAHRLRASIGEVFRYAISTARAANDPTYALRGALQSLQPKHRAAILDPKELGGLLRAIEAFEGQPTTIAALKLMALLFPRPGELRLAEWEEFDLADALWIIPASRTKQRREHRVPLPVQAIAILKALQPVTSHAVLVFPPLA